MKLKTIGLYAALAIITASCESTSEGEASTNDADTAVLVEDPNNNLNANPVNDTSVNGTVPVDTENSVEAH